MSAAHTAARLYLSAPADHFWRWSEEGEAVVWRSGATVAFRAELRAVLARLAPRGLPAFDEVLLLLAPCRANWSLEWLTDLYTDDDVRQHPGLPIWRPEPLNGLEQVHALPPDLRETPEAKATLAEVVFEGRPPHVSAEVATAVIQILESGVPPGSRFLENPERNNPTALIGHLDRLGDDLESLDAETLRLRRRTGLDQFLERPNPEDEPRQPSLRELLRSISDDIDLGGLARIARHLMAVVDLPRRIAEPEDLPLGGVSDIANRGPLDRLLMSELAHDDLTLAVRVAVNEALYLRRESPPRTPPEQRAVLIDCGLRLWGVPRIYAAAVALALAANSEGRSPVAAWRASRDAALPVDLHTREGLTALLESLDSTLHPGNALPAFATEVSRLGDTPESLIITDSETFDDPEFEQALADAAPPACFLATVNRSGEFRLWQRSRQGRKLLREATLDLQSLLEPPKSPKPPRPLVDPDTVPLPAILHQQPFPLRLPHRLDRHNMWKADTNGLYALARDGRLMLWDEKDRGARQVEEGLPVGKVAWGSRTSYIVRPRSNASLVHVRESGPRSQRSVWIAWPGWESVAIPQGDRFVVRNAGSYLHFYIAFRERDGELIPKATYGEDQLVTGGANVHMLGDDFGIAVTVTAGIPRLITFGRTEDGRLGLVEVPLPASLRDGALIRSVRAILRRPGHDGPFGLLDSGEIVSFVDGKKRLLSPGLAPPIKVIEVDDDGSRILLDSDPPQSGPHRPVGRGRFIVDTATGRRTAIAQGFYSLRDYDVFMLVRERTVRRSFKSIASDGATLVLMGRKGKLWRLAVDRDRIVLELDAHRTLQRDAARTFSALRRPKPGFRLHRAAWPDGSVAFLDSRGLLHLRSSDPKIPEATLVLHENSVAGWSADGRTWGDPYFHLADQPTTPAPVIFCEIVQPFAARCVAPAH